MCNTRHMSAIEDACKDLNTSRNVGSICTRAYLVPWQFPQTLPDVFFSYVLNIYKDSGLVK